MDDDNELHPLDVLGAYGVAGSFIETRLARLKKAAIQDTTAIEQAEGMSAVLFSGLMYATSYMTDAVRLIPNPDESETRMRS